MEYVGLWCLVSLAVILILKIRAPSVFGRLDDEKLTLQTLIYAALIVFMPVILVVGVIYGISQMLEGKKFGRKWK